MQTAPNQSRHADPAQESSLTGSRILVVDDEPIIIRVVTSYLHQAGFCNVVALSDSVEAVERMRQESPALILMDISMPDVSGNFLIRIARSDSVLKDVPIIVITADSSPETRERALELGANEVLTKPIHPDQLASRVEAALRARIEKENSEQLARQQRLQPEQETYHRLRNLGGRRDQQSDL